MGVMRSPCLKRSRISTHVTMKALRSSSVPEVRSSSMASSKPWLSSTRLVLCTTSLGGRRGEGRGRGGRDEKRERQENGEGEGGVKDGGREGREEGGERKGKGGERKVKDGGEGGGNGRRRREERGKEGKEKRRKRGWEKEGRGGMILPQSVVTEELHAPFQ